MESEKTPLVNPVYNDFGDEKKGAFHPTGAPFRWVILLVISLICFGSYFTYDEIEPLEPYLNKDLGINHAKFGLLYTVYSIPNFFLVFFGGILGDKIGLRLAGLVFVTLVFSGSVVVTLGPQLSGLIGPKQAFILTAAGRTLFGSGAESLNVIQTSMVSRWFAGTKDLAFAMGLVLSMSRLGDFLTLFLGADIAVWTGNYKLVLWIGVFMCGISYVSVLIYGFMDKASEKYFPNRVVDPEENAVNFKAVLYFDPRFWLIAVICMCYYGGIFPFVTIANDFLVTDYGMSATNAGYYASIVTLSSMVLSPFLGKFLDKVGRRPYFVVLGSLAVIPTHMVLAFHLPYPIIPIIIMGLSFSLVPGALWPSIPLITNPKETATAFGVMAAIQNTGLAAINYVAGKIADSPKLGYTWVMWFFVMMDVIGLIFAIILVIVDKAKGGTLVSTDPKKSKAALNQASLEEPLIQ